MNDGGKALDGLGGVKLTEPNQTGNAAMGDIGSRTVGDEIHRREGKNPDLQLRS